MFRDLYSWAVNGWKQLWVMVCYEYFLSSWECQDMPKYANIQIRGIQQSQVSRALRRVIKAYRCAKRSPCWDDRLVVWCNVWSCLVMFGNRLPWYVVTCVVVATCCHLSICPVGSTTDSRCRAGGSAWLSVGPGDPRGSHRIPWVPGWFTLGIPSYIRLRSQATSNLC